MNANARHGAAISGSYRAALYMRLSKDDDGQTESASIATQRKMLRSYAADNGYTVAAEYIDDGWSGTSFDRPHFKRMIADIEAKKINMVITKDFSRLGRDYITAGQYTETYFPEHGVRYIAINDGYDSANPYNDIAPFKHVVNEMYARDTSQKIRSAFQTKMRAGSYIGSFAPYGFAKDPNNKNHLVIDPEAAAVVRAVFGMAASGARPSEIAAYLNDSGIASPAVYRRKKHPHASAETHAVRGTWTSSTLCKMLANIVYLGHTAQGKTARLSFKSKTTLRKPREAWYIVENTHEPIVTRALYDLARKRSVSRRHTIKTGFQNVFAGVAKCADCGGNMSVTGSRKKGSTYNLVCSRYKLYGSGACSNHFVDYELLRASVLCEIKAMLTLSEHDKAQVMAGMKAHGEAADQQAENTLKILERRNRELDTLMRRLYEDNVSAKITDARFAKLSAAYEAEQRETVHKIGLLKESVAPQTNDPEVRQRFHALLNRLNNINELTPYLVKTLIDRIEIEQGSYEQTSAGKQKRQTARIFWRFAGGIPATA